ncbi:hypothetical protein F3Y22_tig00110515pilonHSYRG00176 [Hibiscus syriacus]|uniref:GRPD C-terminal domain-containing protein n=1 Tax=Hibiscus syriacus TaxID=106335 RepID=A0A6A3AD68_HIBSY|nr:hypothetical protein F3Y22_tig00110515pilonHSYRG00176 [Hibiscus syriacus]
MTAVEFSMDHPYGKAVALMNFKSGIIEKKVPSVMESKTFLTMKIWSRVTMVAGVVVAVEGVVADIVGVAAEGTISVAYLGVYVVGRVPRRSLASIGIVSLGSRTVGE